MDIAVRIFLYHHGPVAETVLTRCHKVWLEKGDLAEKSLAIKRRQVELLTEGRRSWGSIFSLYNEKNLLSMDWWEGVSKMEEGQD